MVPCPGAPQFKASAIALPYLFQNTKGPSSPLQDTFLIKRGLVSTAIPKKSTILISWVHIPLRILLFRKVQKLLTFPRLCTSREIALLTPPHAQAPQFPERILCKAPIAHHVVHSGGRPRPRVPSSIEKRSALLWQVRLAILPGGKLMDRRWRILGLEEC